MTTIHYSADTFLSAAAPNPSPCSVAPAPHLCTLVCGLGTDTSQQWLQSGDSSWNDDSFQLVASWSCFWAYLSWQHMAQGLPVAAKGFWTLQLNAKSKPSPALDSWMEPGNIPGLHCDPSLWEWVCRGVWSNTEIRYGSAVAVKWGSGNKTSEKWTWKFWMKTVLAHWTPCMLRTWRSCSSTHKAQLINILRQGTSPSCFPAPGRPRPWFMTWALVIWVWKICFLWEKKRKKTNKQTKKITHQKIIY